MSPSSSSFLVEKGIDGTVLRRIQFDSAKILDLLEGLTSGLAVAHLDIEDVVQKVSQGLPDELTHSELYDVTSEALATRVIYHPDYATLAGRVVATKLQKLCEPNFSECVAELRGSNANSVQGGALISQQFYDIVMKHKSYFNSIVVADRDFDLPYFGIKTLQKSYLVQVDGVVRETPQFLFLRVAVGIHGENLPQVKETYELMSERYFIHASPTLFNSGMQYNYLSSCFLVGMEDDSIDGIYKTLHKTALISKAAGGIGLHVHNIRAKGSRIASSNGSSSGLVPMLRVFNNTARYVDQGGDKRPGAFAIYIEPWHADVFDVLNSKKNHGKEEMRTRDLFYGLWIPDLFMKRVKSNGDWTLFSPDKAPGLSDCYGEEFEALYESYESQGLGEKIAAQKLWYAILESQTETGGPYMLFKDACNSKSNQQNLGTIKSSNLCCEIVEYSSKDEIAVCNLGSIALPRYVEVSGDSISFSFEKLHDVAKVLTRNLNRIIDVTRYPIANSELSNKRHRPIAIGVQGLADLFCELRIAFDSQEAKNLNIQIFETIYHAGLEASIELAAQEGPYSSFEGSPASKGLLQFDLWDHKPSPLFDDWDKIKERVKTIGLRNSLLVAPMPTASTSQILGFNECFEPYTSNIYTRRVLSGEYQVVNKYLLQDLIELGLWSSYMKDKIISENGSIQNIPSIPEHLKPIYKTVWEIPQRTIIDMASDRGKFIDQSQSMNIHLQNPTFGKLTSCHFYAWEKGLKTGMYYLRTQAASRAIQFTVDTNELQKFEETNVDKLFQVLKKPAYRSVEKFIRRIPFRDLKLAKYPKSKTNVDALGEIGEIAADSLSENDDEDEYRQRSTKRFRSDVFFTPESNARSPFSVSDLSKENFDIYDNTPLACDIADPENCESCSG